MIIITNSDFLGKNLRFLRQRERLTVENMAALLDMEVWELQDLEEGKSQEITDAAYQCLCQHFPKVCEEIFVASMSDVI